VAKVVINIELLIQVLRSHKLKLNLPSNYFYFNTTISKNLSIFVAQNITMRVRNDTLLKSIIEEYCVEFIRFFFSNADEIFDLDKKILFFDKEFANLFPQHGDEENVMYVDKLIQVWRKDGKKEWILIHIEVQDKPEKNFAERMFVYYYHIRDKFKHKITAIVIFTGTNKKFAPSFYKEEQLGTGIKYWFNTYKVFEQEEKTLELSNNPFAVIIQTILLSLKKRKIEEGKLPDLMIKIAENLQKKNISEEKITGLALFLRNYVRLNPENDAIFEKKYLQLTNKNKFPMRIQDQVLEIEKKEARKIGRAEGISQGISQGVAQGEEIKARKVIRNLRLVKKFSIELIAEVVEVSPANVRQILDEMGIE